MAEALVFSGCLIEIDWDIDVKHPAVLSIC